MTRITKVSTLAAIVFALGGSTAMAQSPADSVYQTNGGGVLDVVATSTPAPSSGTAPETAKSTPAPAAKTPAKVAPAVATAAPTTKTEQAQAGDLPFTGFQAGFVGLAGLALLGGGVAMRRAARSES